MRMMKMRGLLAGVLLAGLAMSATAGTAAAATAAAATGVLAQVAPVRVIAWARHVGCEVQYTYVVQNNGVSPIRRLLIGLFQPDEGSGAADLAIMPRLDGRTSWIAPWYSRSPSGWHVKASFPEESSKFALEWIEAAYHAKLWPGAPAIPLPAGSALTGKAVLPGTTVQDFSVMIREPDAAYVEGRANIDYGDLSLNVQIEKGDTIAPTLNLQVGRIYSGNGAWASFEVAASVSDNYDAAPELAQPKIIANQRFDAQDATIIKTGNGWQFSLRNVAGRAYQIQFVATDASGSASLRTVDYASVVNRYR
jgi:hypothetical protein